MLAGLPLLAAPLMLKLRLRLLLTSVFIDVARAMGPLIALTNQAVLHPILQLPHQFFQYAVKRLQNSRDEAQRRAFVPFAYRASFLHHDLQAKSDG